MSAELGEKTGRVRLEGTRWVVAVASGKGGVGKSTVAANLAVALARLGHKVGLLDADIYGPSVPMMFGTDEERPRRRGGQSFYPVEKFGVKLISIGFFLNDKAPMIWRGPMVMGAVRQFLKDTLWGTQDFLVVDLPPGTGDAQLTLAQQVAIDGVVIVTTPQDVALADALRAVRMFRQVHCPLLGVVENMSYFVCPDCGERDDMFGDGGGDRMATEERMEVLDAGAYLPGNPRSGDGGCRSYWRCPTIPRARLLPISRGGSRLRCPQIRVRLFATAYYRLSARLSKPDVDGYYRRMHQLRRLSPRCPNNAIYAGGDPWELNEESHAAAGRGHLLHRCRKSAPNVSAFSTMRNAPLPARSIAASPIRKFPKAKKR